MTVCEQKISGFSLVELSIVLVILGLLTGGVLTGQSLIQAAELRSVSADYGRWMAATQTFRDKYLALPGDMRNATAFWGALDSGDGIGSDCRANAPSIATCNGDGDGLLEWHSVSATLTYEPFLFWHHLANAGLIEGKYTGSTASHGGNTICSPNTTHWVAGCNVPASKIRGQAFWSAAYIGTIAAGHSFLPPGEYGNTLVLGMPRGFSDSFMEFAMNGEQLWNVDVKMDDGLPFTGQLVASRAVICVTGYGLNNEYDVRDPSLHCTPVFKNVF